MLSRRGRLGCRIFGAEFGASQDGQTVFSSKVLMKETDDRRRQFRSSNFEFRFSFS